METKRCPKCTLTKAKDQFGKKTSQKDGLQIRCRECRLEEARKYYAINSEKLKIQINSSRKARKLRINTLIGDYLSKHPCVGCGNKDIRVLDFDHMEGFVKVGNISSLRINNTWETILKEIEKCEVRCKNCHAIMTYERAGNADWRNKYMDSGF